ncbi:MAG TPA: hypothetical protein VFQ42_22315 [Mycobacterium sp.]|nr:hypothetical protein [Mycobacterium sp.]
MKLLVMVATLCAACSSSSDGQSAQQLAPDGGMPDAPTVYPVHQQFSSGCDEAWNTAGSQVSCAAACMQVPSCTGSGAKHGAPCDDKPACTGARNRDPITGDVVGAAVDCPSTFVAVDGAGGYLGCCIASTTPTASGPKVDVAFYECQ